MIGFNNFKAQYASIQSEIDVAVHRVLSSGRYILGKEVERFEREFSKISETQYCVGVASGTEAIALSLIAMGIGCGDEVITSAMTAFPTVTGILQAGAVPVAADIFHSNGLVNPQSIASKISKKTKAILPVHLYGQMADMDAILAIAKKFRLKVVEDCAQSSGAALRGRVAGSWGDTAAFSFYPTKNLGAYGDAGAVATSQKDIFEKVISLRNYGKSSAYCHDGPGINSRLDEIQAAILRVKLKYLGRWNRRRREIAGIYRKNLPEPVCLSENTHAEHTYHLFVIKVRKRGNVRKTLKRRGIETLLHYPIPVHKQKAFLDYVQGPLPAAEKFAKQILSLPIYPELTDQEAKYIARETNKAIR